MPPQVETASAKGKSATPFKGEDSRRRRKILERSAFGLTVLGCMTLLFVIWYTDGKVLDSSIKYLQSFESKDAQASRDFAQNCRDPRNKNTVYCQDRIAQTESDWRAMSRSQNGKTNAYTLHR